MAISRINDYHLAMDDRTAALARAVETGDYTAEPSKAGVRGTKSVLTTPDGGRIFYRDAVGGIYPGVAKDDPDSEQLAVTVAGLVGVETPRVYRSSSGAVYREWLEGTPLAVAKKDKNQKHQVSQLLEGEPGRRLALLDLLIDNRDRHDGNMMVTPDGQLVAIDNGEAWQGLTRHVLADATDLTIGDLATSASESLGPVKQHFAGGRPGWLTDQEIEKLRVGLVELRPQFDKLGRGDHLDSSLAVLDALQGKVKRAAGSPEETDANYNRAILGEATAAQQINYEDDEPDVELDAQIEILRVALLRDDRARANSATDHLRRMLTISYVDDDELPPPPVGRVGG
jgi:hypothetical protein